MNFVIFAGLGEEVHFSEDPADIEILKQVMIPQADKSATELRGQVGNKGNYTGPVRIIMNTYDFGKMRAGDVLVSTMTTPDFVVLMHKAGAIVTDIGGQYEALLVGEEMEKIQKLLPFILPGGGMKEIKGQTAFPGKVTGRARIIIDRRHANELQEGEILVTAMTSPDFVPAMKISAGIVTNEGGVLCHAAIMSRELRKPCVIGTKLATDVIKTGDLVEVDADKGVVKILK